MEIPESEHGKRSTYNKYKCRCDKCRAANTDYLRLSRIRKLAKLTDDSHLHGTRNAYMNMKCRCERCKKANTEYQRARRIRLKEKRIDKSNLTES